jgi:hypothetical protein
MTMTIFASPSSSGGDRLNIGDIKDHHVIINVLSSETRTTTYGDAEAVTINVADLTTGLSHLDVLWFSRVIVSSLRGFAGSGSLVLGTVGQGVAKPGQSAPWVLNAADHLPEVVTAAQAWLDANPGVIAGAVATPAAPAANLAPIAPVANLAPSLGSLI